MTQTKPAVLVVDDESSNRESFSLILSDDYSVFLAATGEAAVKKAADQNIDIVFLDIRMPGMDGIETLKRLKDINSSMEVVMVTAVNDVAQASQAMLLGANNYIVKPFDVDQIIRMTKGLIKKRRNKEEFRQIMARSKSLEVSGLVGTSLRAKKASQAVESLALSDAPVLIVGSSGTEKELAARIIHAKSARKAFPFVEFDVPSGADASHLYAILFGSSKGAFVDALSSGKGLFEKASGGTLFINNLQNLPKSVQEDLHSTIKEKKSRKLGAAAVSGHDTRIIFACSRDLKAFIGEGILIPGLDIFATEEIISLADLNERPSDISALSSQLIEECAALSCLDNKAISENAISCLQNYGWPGNYIQLRNVLCGALLRSASGELATLDLPLSVLCQGGSLHGQKDKASLSFDSLTEKFEKDFIFRVLKRSDFDLDSASDLLGMTKASLSSKIETLEIK